MGSFSQVLGKTHELSNSELQTLLEHCICRGIHELGIYCGTGSGF